MCNRFKERPPISLPLKEGFIHVTLYEVRGINMTEREGKEDDRGGTAEVRFILFIFTVSLLVVVLRGF